MANTSINLLANASAAGTIDKTLANPAQASASLSTAKPFAQWLGDAQHRSDQKTRTEPLLPPDSRSYASAAPTAISALRDDPAQLNAKSQPKRRQRRNGS